MDNANDEGLVTVQGFSHKSAIRIHFPTQTPFILELPDQTIESLLQ